MTTKKKPAEINTSNPNDFTAVRNKLRKASESAEFLRILFERQIEELKNFHNHLNDLKTEINRLERNKEWQEYQNDPHNR